MMKRINQLNAIRLLIENINSLINTHPPVNEQNYLKFYSLSKPAVRGNYVTHVVRWIFIITICIFTQNRLFAEESKHKSSYFTENKGQFRDQYGNPNPDVLYVADFGGMKVLIRKDGFSYETYEVRPQWVDPATIPYKMLTFTPEGDTIESWPGMEDARKNLMYHFHRIDVKALGANPGLAFKPENVVGEAVKYVSLHKKGESYEINSFERVLVSNLYPGIDVIFYTNKDYGGFKYDLVVHPGADLSSLVLEYNGMKSIQLQEESLIVNSVFGPITENIPLSYYEDKAGNRTPTNAIRFSLSENKLRFDGKVQMNDIALLVIDPAVNIVWGTFYGGEGDDFGTAVKTDSLGFIYMCGNTNSPANIATAGSYQDSLSMPTDGFLTKFTSDGQRLWGTYLNGFTANDMDISIDQFLSITGDQGIIQMDQDGNFVWSYPYLHAKTALAVDKNNNIIAVGDSLIKLSPTGGLIWIKNHWHNDSTTVNDITTDNENNIYIAGKTTQKYGIATEGAHQSEYIGSCGTSSWFMFNLLFGIYSDGFINKVDSNGDKIWGTYYGGNHYDEITAIDCNDSTIAIAGYTNSRDFIATENAQQTSLRPQLPFGILFVGIGWDPNIEIIGCGFQFSGNYYQIQEYDSLNQAMDGFVARFSTFGERIWGTYTGEYRDDYCSSVKIGENQNIYVGGSTMGLFGLIPSTYSFSKSRPVGNDYFSLADFPSVFFERYSLTGIKQWGTYYGIEELYGGGGALWQQNLKDIELDKTGSILSTGETVFMNSMATNNCYSCTNQGGYDAFLGRFAEAEFDHFELQMNMNPCYNADTLVQLAIQPDTINLTYQWSKNGTLIEDHNSPDIHFESIDANANGYYKCQVTKGEFTWISDSVLVAPREINTFSESTISDFEIRAVVDLNSDGTLDVIGEKIGLNINGAYEFTDFNFTAEVVNIHPFDIDTDNNPDLIVCLGNAHPTSGDRKTYLFRNDNGVFVFHDSIPELNGALTQSVHAADMDNDSDYDVFIDNILFENQNGKLVLVYTPFDNYGSPVGNLMDFDQDQDVDYVVGGKIYLNDSSYTFSILEIFDNDTCHVHVNYSSMIDLNSDGQMKVVNSKRELYGYSNCIKPSPLEIFSFDGSQFTLEATIDSLPGQHMLGDFNNNGLMDIFLSKGWMMLTGSLPENSPQLIINENPNLINKPTTNAFFISGINAPGFFTADYDNDGDLDVFSGNWDLDVFSGNKVFVNSMCKPTNQPPTAPSGLQTVVSQDTVWFNWQAATDIETPQPGLTYNLRVGTSPGGNDILSALSNADGWRKVVGMGNVFYNKSWWLHKLEEGDYYWSVQAIDNSYAGGPFAPEGSFTIIRKPEIIVQPQPYAGCPGDTVVLKAVGQSLYPLGYQWYRNDTLISNATDSLLVINTESPDAIGSYFCAISNSTYESITDTVDIQIYFDLNFDEFNELQQGRIQFFDFDIDGDLDYLVTRTVVWNPGGGGSYDRKSQLFYNENGEYFQDAGFDYNSDFGNHVVADFNNDGFPDILFFNGPNIYLNEIGMKLFLNNTGVFEEIPFEFTINSNAIVLPGDLNNDGFVDLVIIEKGVYNTLPGSVRILFNQNLTFTEVLLDVPSPGNGDGLLIDYDLDGDLDIYYSGADWSAGWTPPFTSIITNNDGQFSLNHFGYDVYDSPQSIVADLNNDSRPDLIINGRSSGLNPVLKFLLNDSTSSNGFTEHDFGLQAGASIHAIGDFNNDHILDLQYGDTIYLNTGNNLTAYLSAPPGKAVDYNNDGSLDILSGHKLHHNINCLDTESLNQSPQNLSTIVIDSIVYFNWEAIPVTNFANRVSYNLRVGTSPGGSEVLSAQSNQNGYRQIVALGNVQFNTEWWLQGLTPGTYYWSVQAIDNSFAGGPFAEEQTFIVEDYTLKRVSAKVLLEGAYNTGTLAMNNSLLTGNLIPTTQPYSAAPWNYNGEETVTSMPEGIIDWVLVELRQAASAELATEATIIEGWPKALLLKSDGSIVGVDNKNPLIGETEITENLYIVIRHRNHLDVMSSAPLSLSGNTYSYDFTNDVTKAYGGAAGYKQIGTGVYGMVAGDIDADGAVFASDFNLWAINFGLTTVYLPADVDMDGQVFASDFNKWAVNFGTNTDASKTFNISFKSMVP